MSSSSKSKSDSTSSSSSCGNDDDGHDEDIYNVVQRNDEKELGESALDFADDDGDL